MNFEGQQVFDGTAVFVSIAKDKYVNPCDVSFPIDRKNCLVVIPCA